jgi:hypothetical protein
MRPSRDPLFSRIWVVGAIRFGVGWEEGGGVPEMENKVVAEQGSVRAGAATPRVEVRDLGRIHHR